MFGRVWSFDRTAGGSEDEASTDGDEYKIADHLRGHNETCRIGLRHDVTETHGGEDGDCEVERRDPIEVLSERARI